MIRQAWISGMVTASLFWLLPAPTAWAQQEATSQTQQRPSSRRTHRDPAPASQQGLTPWTQQTMRGVTSNRMEVPAESAAWTSQEPQSEDEAAIPSVKKQRTRTVAWSQEETVQEFEELKRRLEAVVSENQRLTQRFDELARANPRAMAEANLGRGTGANEIRPDGREANPGRTEEMISEHVKFGGTIEVVTFAGDDFENVSESDIFLDTAEFDFEVTLSEWALGYINVEWLDGEDQPLDDNEFIDRFNVDEAYIILGNLKCRPYFVKAGRAVVPFGISTGDPVADVLTVNDPLTVEAFETREDIVMLGIDNQGFSPNRVFNTAIYVFNGETNEFGGEDFIEHFGATAGYRIKGYSSSLDFDVDFISSIFDTGKTRRDGLGGAFPEVLENEYVPGIAAHVKSNFGAVSVVAEYNGALDSTTFDVNGDDVTIRPAAWQVQLGYQFGYDPAQEAIGSYGTYIAVGYSESEDFADPFFDRRVPFPESRWLATVGTWPLKGVRLALEYGHDQDYEVVDGGTGNSADAVTAQLTYEW